MSKSKKNVIDPTDIIETYGADTARWFMLSDSPPERDLEWTDAGIAGAWRFVNRLSRMITPDAADDATAEPAATGDDDTLAELRQRIHKTIAGVTGDLEAFHFNRAVARIHELVNALGESVGNDAASRRVRREGFDAVVCLIGPMMPHLGEELWRRLGNETLLADAPWPQADPALLVEDTVTIAVQIRGKLRATIELPRDTGQAEAERAALASPQVAAALEGKTINRIIFVPNRILNVVHS
jgi:leucyl-tRNA synthetase